MENYPIFKKWWRKIKELLEIFDYIGNTANFILYDIDSFNVEF